MEIRLVIFLALVSVIVIANTLMIWFVYRGLAALLGRFSDSMMELQKGSEMRALVNTMHTASEQARKLSEAAKVKVTECGPALARTSREWASTLREIDSGLNEIERTVSGKARKVRDTVARPADRILSVAAGIHSVLDHIESSNGHEG